MEESKELLKLGDYSIIKEIISGDDVTLYIRDHKNEINRVLIKINNEK